MYLSLYIYMIYIYIYIHTHISRMSLDAEMDALKLNDVTTLKSLWKRLDFNGDDYYYYYYYCYDYYFYY